jgi:bifunctional non-homologous end joining protein LigD
LPIYPACEKPHSTPAFRRAGPRSLVGRNGSTRSSTSLIVQREGKRVRLFTCNGYDWSHRFPLIVQTALRNRQTSFVIDGEAVLLGVDGRSDFNGLHSRQHDEEVQFYAFDMLVSDGDDIRDLPLTMRKASLAGLLGR